jgi:hypothetical protein
LGESKFSLPGDWRLAVVDLAPPQALTGRSVGVSISESADLARLGLLESHVRLALAEITRSVLLAGGSLVYGGRISADNYTSFILNELQKYGRRDRPLRVCLAFHEHRRLAISELDEAELDLGLFGSLVCLDVDGRQIDPRVDRGEEPQEVDDLEIRKYALSSMRRFVGGISDARVALGGRRHGFEGVLPGVLEEVQIALGVGQPVYLAGGFGGVVSDIAQALHIGSRDWSPTEAEIESADPRCTTVLSEMSGVALYQRSSAVSNGLSADENARLAVTHRPSDVASLVILGLGRLSAGGQ